MEMTLYVEEKFRNYVPFLELVSLDNDELIVRDHKKDRIVGVKAKRTDGGKSQALLRVGRQRGILPAHGIRRRVAAG